MTEKSAKREWDSSRRLLPSWILPAEDRAGAPDRRHGFADWPSCLWPLRPDRGRDQDCGTRSGRAGEQLV